MFRQRHYANKNYDLKILPDVQEVNGESCVVISITDNSGFEVLEYYGQNSGYLLQESTQMESKTGVPTVVSIIYSDYLPQGVLNFPGNITTTGVGPMGFEMFIKEMKIDQDIDENLFIISK